MKLSNTRWSTLNINSVGLCIFIAAFTGLFLVMTYLVLRIKPRINDVSICSYEKYRDLESGICWVKVQSSMLQITCNSFAKCY